METEGGRGSRGTVGGRKFPQLPKMWYILFTFNKSMVSAHALAKYSCVPNLIWSCHKTQSEFLQKVRPRSRGALPKHPPGALQLLATGGIGLASSQSSVVVPTASPLPCPSWDLGAEFCTPPQLPIWWETLAVRERWCRCSGPLMPDPEVSKTPPVKWKVRES